MIRSENGSNCEEDNAPTLLGKELKLPLVYKLPEPFCLSEEEKREAKKIEFNFFDVQGCSYFSGYVLRKSLSFHAGLTCEECVKYGVKITSATAAVAERDFFTWLKRYDDDSKLYSVSPEFLDFVMQVSRVLLYCFQKYLHFPRFVYSVTQIASESVLLPKFCCSKIREKTISLIVRTLFHYKLKWLNEKLRSSKSSSDRKKKILLHN